MAEDSDYFKTSMVPGLTLDFLDPLLYKVSSLTPNFHRRRENEKVSKRESFGEPDTHVHFLSSGMSQETESSVTEQFILNGRENDF